MDQRYNAYWSEKDNLRCGCLNACGCHSLTATRSPIIDDDWCSAEDAGNLRLVVDTPEIME